MRKTESNGNGAEIIRENTVVHNIDPVFDSKSKILILGSFPSVKSREAEFFYAHPRNRFWSVLASVLECEKPETVEEKKAFLLNNHIALWDVVSQCEISASADASIKNVIPNDVSLILKKADIRGIIVNGKTAEKYYNKYLLRETGIKAVCLPSTSPANAGKKPDDLVAEWSIIKNLLNSDTGIHQEHGTHKYSEFVRICGLLNTQLSVYPLLYGSLGLEKRLAVDLNSDDIDVLLPEKYLKTEWDRLLSLMNNAGYRLVDEHEHEFNNGRVSVAYAALESLTPFADIEISGIPLAEDRGVKYLLLELRDYLKVYEASSKDGYRKNVKNKQDNVKIALIKKALGAESYY